MSKKHFVGLAQALASTKPESLSDRKQWYRDVERVASACQGFNANFDYKRFIIACGVETEAN